jgi:hypothetical protein
MVEPRAVIWKISPGKRGLMSLQGVRGGWVGGCLPYFSARSFRETQVLFGLTSKMLPRSGTPGGRGIAVVILAVERDHLSSKRMIELAKRRQDEEEADQNPKHPELQGRAPRRRALRF